ncbi:DUF2920 family protein [Gimesia sp.]|uniref:DUF2920 family protein n=1 Tax=Gimesia sp. TaxID=2024833 RepID=UPI000C566549|nr:DUF2920 family protein [Gimesia sp.]MAX39193.1 hypothetical protein [Gimesia sp.]HAH48577.1 hypothetical protein [Planctomycetaceae bacterium]|tara:strand:- start:1136 stop:2203 length:1068 start_codon:yes stop_codon:yes gene_type:complete
MVRILLSITVFLIIGDICSAVQAAELPERDSSFSIATQEWPFQPGPRSVKVYLYYPGNELKNVNADTGLMLNLHNWGGTNSSGAGNPAVLTRELNVIAISVDYVQSGSWNDQSGAPYDFGYLQAIDALRALSHVYHALREQKIPFNSRRIYSAGGSGGGNVTLMCNKFAPHTFTCVVDICGMPRLSDDIAFNLPGGSSLDARYSRDQNSADYLSPGAQEIRFIGNPDHLKAMKAMGYAGKIVIIHGTGDTTCPYEDAKQMVQNMQAADLDVKAKFVTQADLDGVVFKNTGHSLGDRTKMIVEFGGPYIIPGNQKFRLRESPTDFELKQDVIYPTSDGRYVISYSNGVPEVRFEAK